MRYLCFFLILSLGVGTLFCNKDITQDESCEYVFKGRVNLSSDEIYPLVMNICNDLGDVCTAKKEEEKDQTRKKLVLDLIATTANVMIKLVSNASSKSMGNITEPVIELCESLRNVLDEPKKTLPFTTKGIYSFREILCLDDIYKREVEICKKLESFPERGLFIQEIVSTLYGFFTQQLDMLKGRISDSLTKKYMNFVSPVRGPLFVPDDDLLSFCNVCQAYKVQELPDVSDNPVGEILKKLFKLSTLVTREYDSKESFIDDFSDVVVTFYRSPWPDAHEIWVECCTNFLMSLQGQKTKEARKKVVSKFLRSVDDGKEFLDEVFRYFDADLQRDVTEACEELFSHAWQ